MKGLRLYLLFFSLLVFMAAWFFLGKKSGSYSPGDKEFAVKDSSEVQSVHLVSRKGEVFLARSGETWMVGDTPARMDAIRGLFMLLTRLQVEAPVSGAVSDRIEVGLDEFSRQVSIVFRGGMEKSYLVYFDSLSNATFMKLDNSGIAFRVSVRGYRHTNLEELYRTDQGYWMDNLVFHFAPQEIKSVTVLYEQNSRESFHLSRNNRGSFDIAGGIIPAEWIPAEEDAVRQYLGYFHDVRFETFLDPGRDVLRLSEKPGMVIQTELINGVRTRLELYPVYAKKENGEFVPDLDRVYARLVNDDLWLIIKYLDIDPILRDFEYFK